MPSAPATLRHSLSTRLFRLTIGIVLAVEVLVFVPDLSHERQSWLHDRAQDARLAILAAAESAGAPTRPTRSAELLRLSGLLSIAMTGAAGGTMLLSGSQPVEPTHTVMLGHEGMVTRTARAMRALLYDRTTSTRVVAPLDAPPGAQIDFVYPAHEQTLALRAFARDFIWTSLLTACLTGALVYVAVALLLVRPMRRLIDSIVAFREAPEHSRPLELHRTGRQIEDEMAVAARELSGMQLELRNALWRNARLAALGNAVARISHDLRAILAPALLTAQRLQSHPDPSVQRSGEILLRTVDRATDLVQRTLDFAREGPPALMLAPVALAPLVDEVCDAVRVPGRIFTVVNEVPGTVLVHADRNQFFRVLANLLRNAADAGAQKATVTAALNRATATIDVADDGPGLPETVRANLFRPFAGSTRHDGAGLGLAIARDLTLAHGGDIVLVATGPDGTTFRLTLPSAAAGDGPQPADGARQAAVPGIAPNAKADV